MGEHRFNKVEFDNKKTLKDELQVVEKPDSNEGLNYRVTILENLHGIAKVVPPKPTKV